MNGGVMFRGGPIVSDAIQRISRLVYSEQAAWNELSKGRRAIVEDHPWRALHVKFSMGSVRPCVSASLLLFSFGDYHRYHRSCGMD